MGERVKVDHAKLLEFIARAEDPEALRQLIRNANASGARDIENAAFRRLVTILPAEQPGTVEHDFWQTIHAFEQILFQERKRKTPLARTRQKVGKVGVVQTLVDWALSKDKTDGFAMLLDRGMPELTGEAIVLRHPSTFQKEVRDAARRRLEEAGVRVADLPGVTV